MIEIDKKALRDYLDEMSASMFRAGGERDFQKEATKDAAEKFEMKAKQLKKMARVYHKQNFTDEVAEAEEFQKMYEEIVLTAASVTGQE
jgi:radical SAM superfamily enzyme